MRTINTPKFKSWLIQERFTMLLEQKDILNGGNLSEDDFTRLHDLAVLLNNYEFLLDMIDGDEPGDFIEEK